MKATAHLCVRQAEEDDPVFVERVSRVLNGTIQCNKPRDVSLVQIDLAKGTSRQKAVQLASPAVADNSPLQPSASPAGSDTSG